ncbi:MAG TPA: sulfotransferase [Thermoanaerobaculia bacterium]|nr:sulfotransferase [Thermoanaerobaculia bacterium]
MGVTRVPTEFASELDPLFVTAPTTRCGTTLLQRLICSAPNALLFGESVAGDIETALMMSYARALMYDASRIPVRMKLESVLSGDVNRWLYDLTPDIDAYLHALRGQYESPLIGARDSAIRHGRAVWGVKYPRWSAATIDLLRSMIPGSRWIYIHRDVLACLRSAKGRGDLLRPGDEVLFAQEWTANLEFALTLPRDERLLLLDYDELARDREAFLRSIEEFSGARPIDRSVLEHRVNDSEGYLPPVELTEQEIAQALAVAGETRMRVYGV